MNTLTEEAVIDQHQAAIGDTVRAKSTPIPGQQRPVRLTVCVEPGAEQHLLQVWTMPRKRVVFDYIPTTNEISTKFTLFNRSNEAYAFKVNSSATDAAYTALPSAGLVNPGQSVEVSILLLLNDPKCFAREIEKDTFTIDLAGADTGHNSVNNFNFHDKRVLFVGISQSAKDRIVLVEEEEKKESVARRKRRQRNIIITSFLAVFIVIFAFFALGDVCDCQD